MATRTRTPARVQFLTDVLTGAIENGGTGWFYTDEYRWEDMGDAAYAVVTDHEDDGATHRIDLDVIARGLGVIKAATMGPVVDHHGDEVLTNAATGERLYLAPHRRREIMLTDRTNGEDGNLDAHRLSCHR